VDDIGEASAHDRRMNVVECRGLTKVYGSVAVVDGLDLVIESGSIFGLVGPNGAGKTTTLRMLLGLVHESRGSMAVNGRELPDPDGLDRVGAMIEEPSFYPWLSGRRNLEVLARCGRRLSSDAIDAALVGQGLVEPADRKVKTYSQGMRQRLGLAAALMRSPDLLILDEPTNGMDPAGLRSFRMMLRGLADGGVTVLLSSHLLSEVEHLCDVVGVMNRGRLIESGAPTDLSSVRAQVLVRVAFGDVGAATELLSKWPVSVDAQNLVVDCGDARAVNERLGSAGVWAERLDLVRPSLEDAFLALTDGSEAA
jgi:ABC-2 type transport system ATP-binding protein